MRQSEPFTCSPRRFLLAPPARGSHNRYRRRQHTPRYAPRELCTCLQRAGNMNKSCTMSYLPIDVFAAISRPRRVAFFKPQCSKGKMDLDPQSASAAQPAVVVRSLKRRSHPVHTCSRNYPTLIFSSPFTPPYRPS